MLEEYVFEQVMNILCFLNCELYGQRKKCLPLIFDERGLLTWNWVKKAQEDIKEKTSSFLCRKTGLTTEYFRIYEIIEIHQE